MNTFSRSSASLLALSLALSVIACGGQVGDRNGSGDDNISSGGDAGTGGTSGNETGGDDPGGSNPGGSNPGGSTGGSSRSGIALFRYQLDNIGTGGTAGTGGIGTGGAGGDWGSSGTCGGGTGGTAGYAGGYDGGGAYAGAGGEPGGTGGTGGYYGGAAGVGGAGGSAGTGGYYGGSAGIGGEGGYYGGSAGSYGGTGAGAVAGSGGAPQSQTLFLFVDSTPNHAATQCWAPYEALPCGAWRVTVGIDPQLIHPGVSTFALSTPGIDAFFSSSGPGADPNSCAGWGGGSFIDGSITLNFDGSSVLKGSFEGTNGIDFNANGDFEVSWCP